MLCSQQPSARAFFPPHLGGRQHLLADHPAAGRGQALLGQLRQQLLPALPLQAQQGSLQLAQQLQQTGALTRYSTVLSPLAQSKTLSPPVATLAGITKIWKGSAVRPLR